jgi:hypothetical protein
MLRLRLAAAAFLCAPLACLHFVDNPGQARQDHNVTLGVPGALFHPAKSLGVVTKLEMPTSGTAHVVSGGHGESSYSISEAYGSNDREVKQRDMSARLSALHFPSPNSFFFWGVTSRYGETRAAYQEHTTGFDVAEPHTATVEWTDRYATVGPTIGTSLMYVEDKKYFLTSLIGVSYEAQVYTNRAMSNDGSAMGVDGTMRDATLASYSDYRKKATPQYYTLIGVAV